VYRSEAVTAQVSPDAARYAEESRAPATRRAYLCDTRRFASWCATRGLSSTPASIETVANFLSWMASNGFRIATIERNLVAISIAHRQLGFESPRRSEFVREVLRGIRRGLGVAPRRKRALVAADLKAMLAATADGIKGSRDRALLALCFAGALRRGELVGLDVADVTFMGAGVEILIRKSKTDQEGAGARIGVPHGIFPESCPVRLVRAWMQAAGLEDGPLFRPINRHGHVSSRRLSGKAVATLVKSLASTTGVDPTTVGAHSLRAGLVTTAIRGGKSERLVMKHTRHRSVAVFRSYVRDADLFAENAAASIGL
jgi:site-specific recombinase XerD